MTIFAASLVDKGEYNMAKKGDGRRNVKSKTSKRYPRPGRSFNHLEGDSRQWAKDNHFYVSEQCVAVKNGRRFSGSDDTKLKCGDGRSGFSTRRIGQDDGKMEVGLEGQYKKRRLTLVNPKSARCAASRKARRVDGSVCCLINSVQIAEAMRDPQLVSAERRLARFLNRPRSQMNRRERQKRVTMLSKLKTEVIKWM